MFRPSAGETSAGVEGATLSIRHVYDAGLVSTLPAGSVALTSNVCVPSARPAYVAGVVHAEKPAPSRRHSKVDPGSFDPRSKVALAEDVFAGGSVGPIDETGGVVSIVHVYEAGVGSVFPAVSVARTWNVWLPSARAE